MLAAATVVIRSETALVERLLDEQVVLDPATGRFVKLNGSGAVVWEALERTSSLAELADGLVSRYGIDRERALSDVTAFVSALHERELVSLAPAAGA